jgi:hypothetical protein
MWQGYLLGGGAVVVIANVHELCGRSTRSTCCDARAVVLFCRRDYYDDPAHANELHGVDKDKYVAGGCAQDPKCGTSIGGLHLRCCCGLTVARVC